VPGVPLRLLCGVEKVDMLLSEPGVDFTGGAMQGTVITAEPAVATTTISIAAAATATDGAIASTRVPEPIRQVIMECAPVLRNFVGP